MLVNSVLYANQFLRQDSLLALTPNISLVIINLILQSVGDGSQPLMSKYYGEKRTNDLTEAKHMAYTFAIIYLPYYSDKLYDKIRDF